MSGASRRRQHSYTIAGLLAHQPAGMQRLPGYRDLLARYRTSDRLKRVRLSRRGYSVLLHARVPPDRLRLFLRAQRLPVDPFFPLYLALKRDYLSTLERKREEKRRWIIHCLQSLPQPLFQSFLSLAYLEQYLAGSDETPIWAEELVPKTKKAARHLIGLSRLQWMDRFEEHLNSLVQRYRNFSAEEAELFLALFVLELPPSKKLSLPVPLPSPTCIKEAFRRLSKREHPDAGGDGMLFVKLKWAVDILISRPADSYSRGACGRKHR